MGVKGWEVVFRGDRMQADLLAAVLEANGLRAEVFGDTAYSYAINFTEARVMVPADQAEHRPGPDPRRPGRDLGLPRGLALVLLAVVVLAVEPPEC